jgi:hypothetical protein
MMVRMDASQEIGGYEEDLSIVCKHVALGFKVRSHILVTVILCRKT